MARPSKKVHERRDRTLGTRFTPAEAAYVETQAAAAGLTLSDYLRTLALTEQVKPRKSKLEASFLVELNRIGVNLNQIAHAANTGRTTEHILRAAIGDLGKIMKRLDEAL